MDKPDWWEWSFECENDHIVERMVTRGFNETDLREMIENTVLIEPGDITTRYNLYSPYNGRCWKIVVEPDPLANVVVIVTAFEIESLP